MNIRLLRATRFMAQFQKRYILAHPAHPSTRRGPRFLAPLFRCFPKAFLVYVLAQQKLSPRGFTIPTSSVMALKASRKVLDAQSYLHAILGDEFSLSKYPRKTSLLLSFIRNRAFGAEGDTKRRNWLESLSYLTRGQDRHIVFCFVEFLVTYGDLREVLRRQPPAFFLCDSDLMPRRIAAACAAEAESVPVLFWQSHYAHQSTPPFGIDCAVLLNDAAYAQVRSAKTTPCAPVIRRSDVFGNDGFARPRQVSDPPSTIGVALNAMFQVDSLKRMLQALRNRFPTSKVLIRLHPRSKQHLTGLSPNMVEASKQQSLQDFSNDCELGITGNTGSQIEMLGYGLAVVHLPGFDPFGYDAYRYVEHGVVFGAETFQEVDIQAINTFYRDAGWHGRMVMALGEGTDKPSQFDPEHTLKKWLELRFPPKP